MFFARPAKLSITDYGPDGKPAGEVRAVQARPLLESNHRFQSLIVKNDNIAFNLNPVFLSSHPYRKPHVVEIPAGASPIFPAGAHQVKNVGDSEVGMCNQFL